MKVVKSLVASVITFCMTILAGVLVYISGIIIIPDTSFMKYVYLFGAFTSAVVFSIDLWLEVNETDDNINSSVSIDGVMVYGNGKEMAFVKGNSPQVKSVKTGQVNLIASDTVKNIWLLDDLIEGNRNISCLVELTSGLQIYRFNEYSISFDGEED